MVVGLVLTSMSTSESETTEAVTNEKPIGVGGVVISKVLILDRAVAP